MPSVSPMIYDEMPERVRFIQDRTLTHDIVYGWWHMRRTTARLIASEPGEVYLLWILLLSTLAFMLAWTIRQVVVPTPSGLHMMALEFSALLRSVVVRTLAMYVFAMVLAAVCRLLGGTGSWRDTRIAVFWAALVAAPFDVMMALNAAALHWFAVFFPLLDAPLLTTSFYWMGLLAFLWYLAGGVAQVQRFRSTAACFMYLTIATLVSVMLALYFLAHGVI